MPYKPGDTYTKEFTISSPTTGAAVNADATPTATVNHTGPGTGSMSFTPQVVATGHYRVTSTIPAGWLAGDTVNVVISATVGGVAAKAVIDTFPIDDLTGRKLGAAGLDAISVSDPGAASGHNTLPRMIVATWRALWKKNTQTSSLWRRYADDNNTTNSQAAISDDGTTQAFNSFS